jgi:hypothetical protein
MGKTAAVVLAFAGLALVARDTGQSLARGAVFARVLGVEVHVEVRLQRPARLDAPPPPTMDDHRLPPDTVIVSRSRP